MSIRCNRCDGTGFLNLDHIPDDDMATIRAAPDFVEAVEAWIARRSRADDDLGGCSCHIVAPCGWCVNQHEVQVCDCCGDGHGWHGEPGQHYTTQDPQGPQGPYAGNGGLCQCH